jgi:cytidylate kinase
VSIITISRGSYSRGKEVAEKVAERLGYECVGREMIIDAAKQSHIPEVKLVRAIHDAPSILDRVTYGKEKYVAHVQAALVRLAKNDNLVYHGLAGHFLLRGVSHVLKVRIMAELEDRVAEEMQRENISHKEALHIINSDDEERRKWSKYLYGIDTWDPCLYDLVLHIKKLSVDDAVDIICHAVDRNTFEPTPQSRKAMDDLALASEVKAVLVDIKPDVEVEADDGEVLVKTMAAISLEEKVARDIEKAAASVPGVGKVRISVRYPDYD